MSCAGRPWPAYPVVSAASPTAWHRRSWPAESLRAAQGKLYLSGVDPALIEQFTRAGHLQASGPVEMVEATPNLGESSLAAYHQAETWMIEHRQAD